MILRKASSRNDVKHTQQINGRVREKKGEQKGLVTIVAINSVHTHTIIHGYNVKSTHPPTEIGYKCRQMRGSNKNLGGHRS